MTLNIKKGYQQLVAEAEKEIETISVDDALKLHGSAEVVFVDLRDVRELSREGFIPEAFHCPRGMLEFWIDPDCIYYKEIFASGKKFLKMPPFFFWPAPQSEASKWPRKNKKIPERLSTFITVYPRVNHNSSSVCIEYVVPSDSDITAPA